jgi:hypothetical protein
MSENRRTANLVNGIIYVDDIVSAVAPISGVTFTLGDTTPSVTGGNYFISNSNTGITDFLYGVDKQWFELFIPDNITTILYNASKIILPGGIDLAFKTGDIIRFRRYNNLWYVASLMIV